MAKINISIPDPMKDWIQNQIDGEKYTSASDYLRDLVREDQQEQEKIVALKAAIHSGMGPPS